MSWGRGGFKDASVHPDHSIISLIWVCASPDGSWARFGAEQGPGDAPDMQGVCGHLVFGEDVIPSTFAGMHIAPRIGVRPLSQMERREDDDGAEGG